MVVAGWEVLSAIACALTAVHFLPKYWAADVATTPEYLKKRFDRWTHTIVCGCFLVGGVLQEMPAAVYTGAVAFDQIFGLQKQIGWQGQWGKFAVLSVTIWFTGLLGALYAVVGGLKAVAISDTINGVGMFVGGLSVPMLGLSYIGKGSVFEGASILYSSNKDKFNMVGGATSTIPYPSIFFGMPVIQMYYWCMQQVIIQRTLAAKNLHHGQKGTVVAGFLKVLVPWIIVLPGIIAFHILREDGVELKGNTDEAYPRLMKKVLPEWSMGIFAAVIIGAVLSTFNSNLNTIAQMLTLDIYKVWINPTASEEKLFKVARNVGIFTGGFALTVAPFFMFTPAAYAFLVSVNGLWNAPVFVLYVCGTMDFTLLGTRYSFNHLRPRAAHVCSAVTAVTFIFFRWVLPACIKKAEIHSLYATGIAASSGILTMIVHGHFWPLEEFEIQKMLRRVQKSSSRPLDNNEYVEMIDVGSPGDLKGIDFNDGAKNYDKPWKMVKVGALFITLFAIVQYIIFH